MNTKEDFFKGRCVYCGAKEGDSWGAGHIKYDKDNKAYHKECKEKELIRIRKELIRIRTSLKYGNKPYSKGRDFRKRIILEYEKELWPSNNKEYEYYRDDIGYYVPIIPSMKKNKEVAEGKLKRDEILERNEEIKKNLLKNKNEEPIDLGNEIDNIIDYHWFMKECYGNKYPGAHDCVYCGEIVFEERNTKLPYHKECKKKGMKIRTDFRLF